MRALTIALTASLMLPAPPATADMLPVCSGGDRAERQVTCIVDGDTGWEDGVKWRAAGVDTPEVSRPQCKREEAVGLEARDRLRELMASGYAIEDTGETGSYGRPIVRVRLEDGRVAGQVLVEEGLSQPWPNDGGNWCK